MPPNANGTNHTHSLRSAGTQPTAAASPAIPHLGSYPEPQMSKAVLGLMPLPAVPPQAAKRRTPRGASKDLFFISDYSNGLPKSWILERCHPKW